MSPHPAIGLGALVNAGRGHHVATIAAHIKSRAQAPPGIVGQRAAGMGEVEVPSVSAGPYPQGNLAKASVVLEQGIEAGLATMRRVHVDDHQATGRPGADAHTGVRPSGPPCLDDLGVDGGVVEAMAAAGMLATTAGLATRAPRTDGGRTDGGVKGQHGPSLGRVGQGRAKSRWRGHGDQCSRSGPARRAERLVGRRAGSVLAGVVGEASRAWPAWSSSALSFVDRDYGRWTGRSAEELVRSFGDVNNAPGVEPASAVTARAVDGLREMAARADGRLVAVVAHDADNRLLLAHLVPGLDGAGLGSADRMLESPGLHPPHGWEDPVIGAVPGDGASQ